MDNQNAQDLNQPKEINGINQQVSKQPSYNQQPFSQPVQAEHVNPITNKSPNTKKAMLWFFSPFILLILLIIFSILAKTIDIKIVTFVINIVSVFGGITAIILIPVGIIRGVLLLSKK